MPDTVTRGPWARTIAAAGPHWARSVLPPAPSERYAVTEAERARLAGTLDGGLCCVFPTHARRDLDGLSASLTRWLEQLELVSAQTGLPIGVVVSVQWKIPGDEPKAREIANALAQLPAPGLRFLHPVVLNSCVKADSVSAGYAIGEAAGASATMWIDDDVVIEDGGMEALAAALLDPALSEKTVFGLAGRIIGSETWVAKNLTARRKAKRRQWIPYGCCCLVRNDAGVLPIPSHLSDDQWATITQLTPGGGDTFARFHIINEPRVQYCVAQTFAHHYSRMKRTYTNSVLAISSVDPERGAAFMRDVYFGGVVWKKPGERDGNWSVPVYLKSLAVRTLNMTFWTTNALLLYLRGALNRPARRPAWAVNDKYMNPLQQQPDEAEISAPGSIPAPPAG